MGLVPTQRYEKFGQQPTYSSNPGLESQWTLEDPIADHTSPINWMNARTSLLRISDCSRLAGYMELVPTKLREEFGWLLIYFGLVVSMPDR